MDGIFWITIIFVLIAGIIGFILKIFFWGWLFKSAVDYWSPFQKDYDVMQSIMSQYSGSGGGHISSLTQNRFQSALWTAQNHLSHLDDLRRQRGELMMADMKSQAASVGLFID